MRLPHNRCEEQIDYIVEARMHVGHSFSKHKLGQWFVIVTDNFQLELMHSLNSKYVPPLVSPDTVWNKPFPQKRYFSFFFQEFLIGFLYRLDDSMSFGCWQ